MAPAAGDVEKAEATLVADYLKERVARTDYPNSNQTTEKSAQRDEDEKKSNLAALLTQIFITSCVVGVLMDPLFLYIPLLNQDLKCLRLDNTIEIIALVSRSFTDLFYVGRIILQVCRFEKCSPSTKQFLLRKRSSKLIEGLLDLLPEVSNEVPKPSITKEIWESSIIVDILAILPFPQVLIRIYFSKMRVPRKLNNLINVDKYIIFFFIMGQYVPRVLPIYQSCKKAKPPFKGHIPLWLKTLLSFYMYLLASHVLGAFWYFLAAQKMISCWEHACRYGNGCGATTFNCDDHQTLRNITVLNDFCPINPPDTTLFDFGIYLNVIQSGALWSTDFLPKFLISFCWGLQNLSSFASNLQPSFHAGEIFFVAFISSFGVILFVYLIGNLRTINTERLEEQRRKNKLHKKIEETDRTVEKWLSRHGIPLIKKQKIMEEIKKRDLEENSDFDVEREILSILSKEEINSCSPLSRLRKVPLLQGMDEGVLIAISYKLKPEKYIHGDIIIGKDEPLEKMLFIVDGCVTIEQTDGSQSELGAGDFYGDELLVAQLWTSSGGAKTINESVQAIDDVQALVLYARDMESISSKSKSIYKLLYMVTILKKVPLLKDMDEGVLREISKKLKPEKYTPRQIIIEKDKTLEMMLFIVDGRVTIEKTDSSWSELGAENFYGEQLLVEPLGSSFSDGKPIINESVKAIDDVQALVLYARDMESISSKSKSIYKLLCMVTILKKVPLLKDMDEGVLREISEKLKPEKYTRGDIIIEKDKTLEKMLFIVDGRVTIGKTDGPRLELGAGDFYGGQLLVEPLGTSYSDAKPIINESVKAIDDVRALVLYATDMESFSSKFKSIYKKLCMVTILKKVPLLKDMDEEVLREISKKLKPEKYTPGQIIIEKDKTFEKMLFILDGHVTIVNPTHSMRPLGAGDFYGGNLLVALSWTSSGDAKLITDESVEALDDVQALVLYATDMESISSKSKSIHKKLCMVTTLKKIIEIDRKVESSLPGLGIPLHKKHIIMEGIKRKLEEDSDIDVVREILSILPSEEIKSCRPLSRLRQVPLLKDMDEGVLVEISDKLHPKKYTRGQIIIEKDKTLEKMLFIVDGRVTIKKTDGSQPKLDAGKFYGEELLVSPSCTSSGDAKPINDECVEALDGDVEALVLYATDMERISYKSKSIYKKLCMVTILKKVKIFQQMDEQVLKAISKRLKPMSFNAKKYILKEKKPLNMMFVVVRGVVLIESESAMDVNERKTVELGSFYGEELVHWVTTWLSHQTFPTKLPSSPDSALCPYHGGAVKILALKADDLKSVLSDFTLPTDSDQTPDRLTILKNVERLETMDEEVLKEICGYLELRTYEDAYIIQKDKPIEMMFFIMSGVVSVTDGSSKHYRNEGGPPNHSGDYLIEHWLQSKSTGVPAELRTSPFSFWAIGEVKVLVLKADDLAKVQPRDQIC